MRTFLLALIRIYWRIMRPRTFGVKVVISHPENPDMILLIRNSYGNKQLWNIPGGGYNPRRETAFDAARREVREELSIALLTLDKVGEYYTEAEGKRDTVALIHGTIASVAQIRPTSEIAETEWVNQKMALDQTDVARIARTAIRAIHQG